MQKARLFFVREQAGLCGAIVMAVSKIVGGHAMVVGPLLFKAKCVDIMRFYGASDKGAKQGSQRTQACGPLLAD